MEAIIAIVIIFIFILCAIKCQNEDNERAHFPSSSTANLAYSSPSHDSHNGNHYVLHVGEGRNQRPITQQHQNYRQRSQGNIVSLHDLTQKIVLFFEGQRNPGEYQFAVLIMMPAQSRLILRTGVQVVSCPDEATDRSNPTFPYHTNLCNFITARPDGGTHAEAALMTRLPSLLKSYNALMRQECRTILLYSWLFPCNYCKRKIINTLGSYTASYDVLLIYTSTLKDMDDTQVASSTYELGQSGISVRHEEYDRYLPPASL